MGLYVNPMEGQELLPFLFVGGRKSYALFWKCIFRRNFLSPRTAIVLGIENYPSACMSFEACGPRMYQSVNKLSPLNWNSRLRMQIMQRWGVWHSANMQKSYSVLLLYCMKLIKRVMYVADAVSVLEPPETVFEKKKKKNRQLYRMELSFSAQISTHFMVMQSRSKQARNIVDWSGSECHCKKIGGWFSPRKCHLSRTLDSSCSRQWPTSFCHVLGLHPLSSQAF